MMTAHKIRDRIAQMASHVVFSYKDWDCGVDPLSVTCFDMWCGDDAITVNSLDAVMCTPFFHGKALQDIASEIELED